MSVCGHSCWGNNTGLAMFLPQTWCSLRKPQLVVTKGNFRCGECSQTVNTAGHRLTAQKINTTDAVTVSQGNALWVSINLKSFSLYLAVQRLQLLVDYIQWHECSPCFLNTEQCLRITHEWNCRAILRCFVHTSNDQITYQALLQPLS